MVKIGPNQTCIVQKRIKESWWPVTMRGVHVAVVILLSGFKLLWSDHPPLRAVFSASFLSFLPPALSKLSPVTFRRRFFSTFAELPFSCQTK